MPEIPQLDPTTVDRRIAERYIRNGMLDEKVWEKYLKALPDAAEKAAPVEETLSDDIDDEDDDE